MNYSQGIHAYSNIYSEYFRQPQAFQDGYHGRESPLYETNPRLYYGSCKYCLKYHSGSEDKCYFVCHYCKGIHLKNNLNDQSKNHNALICPLIRQTALIQQNKKAFPCDSCGGNGQYQKVILTTCIQIKQSFLARLSYYQQQKSQGNINIQEPTRNIYKNKEQIKKQKCEKCNGTGKIYKMIKCCQGGCEECQFSGIKPNSKWCQMRLQGVQNTQSFPCKICSQQVKVGEMIFELHCGHAFHKGCILSWLYIKQGCFLCSKIDPYLQRVDFPLQCLTKLKFILKNEQEKMNRQLNYPKSNVVELKNYHQKQISDKWDIFYEIKQRKENAPSTSIATIQQYIKQQKEEEIQKSMLVKLNVGVQSQSGAENPWQQVDIANEFGQQTRKWWVTMRQLLKEQQKSEYSSQIKQDLSF